MARELEGLELPSGGEVPRRFSGEIVKASLFAGDRNCVSVGDGERRGVADQARQFAGWLRKRYSASNKPVDVIASGTSGLVVRYALGRAAAAEQDWPRPLLVEDAITIGTPHVGAPEIADSCSRVICRQMDSTAQANASLFRELQRPQYQNPQGEGGTDWTLIGSDDDRRVDAESATAMLAAHAARYQSDADVTRTDLLEDTSKRRDVEVEVVNASTGVTNSNTGVHPVVRAVMAAVLGATKQPTVLTTARLRQLVRQQPWGAGLAGVTFNRAAGRSFQEAVLRMMGWVENTRPFLSPQRTTKTVGRVKSVIPDSVRNLLHVVIKEKTIYRYLDSTFDEVKAETKALRLSKRDHQLLGMIDVAAISPAGTSMRSPRPTPVLNFILTAPSLAFAPLDPALLAEATKRRVAVNYSLAFEVPATGTSAPRIGLSPFIPANPQVYPKSELPVPETKALAPAQSALAMPSATEPLCDPDPPELDSLEGGALSVPFPC
jgi:hypothetical protein